MLSMLVLENQSANVDAGTGAPVSIRIIMNTVQIAIVQAYK